MKRLLILAMLWAGPVMAQGFLPPFVPTVGGYTSLAAGGTTGNVVLPGATQGYNVAIINGGTDVVWVRLGGSGITVTALNGQPVYPGVPLTLPLGTNTYLAGLANSGTQTLGLLIGSGFMQTTGATGGGGGSGGNVTQGTTPWVQAPQGISPAAGTTGTLTTGGTTYTVVTGPVNGCYIYNGATTAEQGGIAATESVNVDPTGVTPAVGAIGTTSLGSPQGWSCPGPLLAGSVVKANAVTSGHKLNVVVW